MASADGAMPLSPTSPKMEVGDACPAQRASTLEETFAQAKAVKRREAEQAKMSKKASLDFDKHEDTFVMKMHTVFESQHYDVAIAAIVAANVVLLIIETDCNGVLPKRQPPFFVTVGNYAILIGFICEMILKMFIYRWTYFKCTWNIMDFLIVVSDILCVCLSMALPNLPSLSMLRSVRLVRLGKSIQFLMMFPELGLMLTALKGTIKSLCWGAVLITIGLILFSILAVQLINPINQEIAATGYYDPDQQNCERCPRAFESVWQSLLTFFQQLIAGDSWGTLGLPISEKSPAAWLFLSLVLVCIELLVMNVILAAVVDSAQQARASNIEIIAQLKEEERRAKSKELLKLCEQLDTDRSGSLTFNEVLDGFTTNVEFYNLMEAMDISSDDISFVWGILDADGSGEVNYQEFSEELFKMKTKDTRTMVLFIKYHVTEMRNDIRSLMRPVADMDSEVSLPKFEQKLQDTPVCPSPQLQVMPDFIELARVKDDVRTPSKDVIVPAGPDIASLINLSLKETLRLFEAKLETTNQLISTMRTDMARESAIAAGSIPPQLLLDMVSSGESMPQEEVSPWLKCCSTSKAGNRAGMRADWQQPPALATFPPSPQFPSGPRNF